MNMPPPLTIEGLTKHYGNTAVVDGLSLEVQPGRCHGLLGPNGAGKTTTLRLALGLTRPDAGEIRLLGHPVPGEAAVARGRGGVVPQSDKNRRTRRRTTGSWGMSTGCCTGRNIRVPKGSG